MLKKRLITSFIGIPLLIAAAWFNEPVPWFVILVTLWGLFAVLEFYKITRVSQVLSLTCLGLLFTGLLIASPYFGPYRTRILTIAVLLSLVLLVFRSRKEGAFTSWAWTIAGIIYVGWLLSYPIELRGMDGGRNWIFLAIFVTFVSDSSSFIFGRMLGKRHLAPHISPAKTWEGSAAGVLSAVLFSLLFLLPTPAKLPLLWWEAVILGALISVFGQLGDLVESLLKRNMQVKDSGHLIPGHGGFLDRSDSIVFAAIVVYYYVVWLV